MEKRIRQKIKILFNEIKKLRQDRKTMYKNLEKSKSSGIGTSLLFYDLEIEQRLYTITNLMRILFNNEKIWNVTMGDFGKNHIYLSYHERYSDGGLKIKGIDYRV